MKTKHGLTREQFVLLNSLYNTFKGRPPIFSDKYLNEISERSEIMEQLVLSGYADSQYGMITAAGIEALAPFAVRGAVIMAAGPSTRCIPLSLEQPKGLFEVKGQRLIDRQIEQLKAAGIEDISVVLGYKKEKFFYLAEKYGVRLIENDEYLVKNNIHSLYLAKERLADAYICCCDDWFEENPFNRFEYESFFAGVRFDRAADEMYAFADEDGRIVKLKTDVEKGMVLLGHSFWESGFAERFIAIAQREAENGPYAGHFWEWLLKDFLDELPAMYLKKYARNEIVELDYFDDLRRFDSVYVKNANSRILKNIISVFDCNEDEITDFRNISEGMTNISFIFKYRGVDYIYRYPGEGTELIVNRCNEKNSLELMKKCGIDPTYVYMNVEQGWKISCFVSNFREPEYDSKDDGRRVAAMLRRLHALPIKTDYGLCPWEDAQELCGHIEELRPGEMKPYDALRERIGRLYKMTEGDGVEKCFCHGDTYKHNWMLKSNGEIILIDWEYSGYSDPGVDVGYYIVDAMYDREQAECFIREYLGRSDRGLMFHYLAYCAIIAYYWFVWAVYREACGANIGAALTQWRDMAYRFADIAENY